MISKFISHTILPSQTDDPIYPCDKSLGPLSLSRRDLELQSASTSLYRIVFNIIEKVIKNQRENKIVTTEELINTELRQENKLNNKWKPVVKSLIDTAISNTHSTDREKTPEEITDTMISSTIAYEQWEEQAKTVVNSILLSRQQDGEAAPTGVDIKSKDVKTADGDWVRLYKFTPENFDQASIPSKRIAAQLYVFGNGSHAEELVRFVECAKLAARAGIPVYTLNFRNVGSSYRLNQAAGRTNLPCNLNSLREDAMAAFNYMLADGIPSGKIELRGWSLGGVVAGELANSLRSQVNLESCPYLTTQQTLSSFSSYVVSHFIGSNAKYYLGYLDIRNFYFSNLIGKCFELALLKPLLFVAASLLYLIAKPILMLTGWNTNNGINYAAHPAEKRRNLHIETPDDILSKEGVADDHIDDLVIRPLAAVSNSVFVKVPAAIKASYDEAEKTRQQANTFYNQSEVQNHTIKNGHSFYSKLTNIHDENIDESIVNHIRTLNGETGEPISKYYPGEASEVRPNPESLAAPEEMKLSYFIQHEKMTDKGKISTIIKDIIEGSKQLQDLNPISVAGYVRQELQDIVSVATKHSFVLSLYKELLKQVSLDNSLLKNLLIDRRSNSESTRFSARLALNKPKIQVTKAFAQIQQAFSERLEQLPRESDAPPEFVETALAQDVTENDYGFMNSLKWMLFGETKTEQEQELLRPAHSGSFETSGY